MAADVAGVGREEEKDQQQRGKACDDLWPALAYLWKEHGGDWKDEEGAVQQKQAELAKDGCQVEVPREEGNRHNVSLVFEPLQAGEDGHDAKDVCGNSRDNDAPPGAKEPERAGNHDERAEPGDLA